MSTFTGLDSIYVNRDPIYDTELATKQYTDINLTMNHLMKNTDHIEI